jgi:RNA recognition motif-containing protein
MTEMTDENGSGNTNPKDVDQKLDAILSKYSETNKPSPVGSASYSPPAATYYRAKDVKSTSFDAQNLQKVVDEIKVIEDGIKNIIASRTKKIVEEKVPVQKQRPVKYNPVGKALVSLGLKRQEMENYTDHEIVKKEVPRQPDEVLVTEFRGMIEDYINSLKGLNEGLRETVTEVDKIVKNLTDVSDAFTDQIHRDRIAYDAQIKYSKELEEQLTELIPIHESMSPIHERYAQVEKARDHIEMALRESQGMELKYKTNIDMGVKYQKALKSYRTLINDFKERGDIHVNMVDKFAEGAGHMKIAVDNVSQICSGVAKVTQSMIMIVESIDDGNRVLGRYASLIGDQMASGPKWQMEYNALREAEATYRKNDELRVKQIEDNRQEIDQLIHKTGSDE